MQNLQSLQRASLDDVRRLSAVSDRLKLPHAVGGTDAVSPAISIIIPTFNEEKNIGRLIDYLQSCDCAHYLCEIIVADGGSRDCTVAVARAHRAKAVLCPHKGRAAQMNYGAQLAQGNVFYFLHADSFPPRQYLKDIAQMAVERNTAGSYRLKFDTNHWFLRVCCWFTRFDINAVRFGDQSLFVRRSVFEQIGGFNTTLQLMEDQEIIARIKRYSGFTVANGSVLTSARKYASNGVFRLQFIYLVICVLYALGCSQKVLLKLYRRLVAQGRV